MTETAGIARLDVAAPRTGSPHPNGGVFRRAALVALILGSVLTLANQSGAVFGPAPSSARKSSSSCRAVRGAVPGDRLPPRHHGVPPRCGS